MVLSHGVEYCFQAPGGVVPEAGTLVKDWGGRIPIALCFPSTYHTAMSNLGFQAIYAILNAWPDVVCERVVCPTGTCPGNTSDWALPCSPWSRNGR
jgi:hypothetical protein